MLALMVTFEQEYAVQNLFKRHGWDFTKITDDVLIKTTYPAQTAPSEQNRTPVHTEDNSQVTVGNKSKEFKDSSDADECNDEEHVEVFAGDTDSEQALYNLDTAVKEKVDMDTGDATNSISSISYKTVNSGKQVGQTKPETVGQEKRIAAIVPSKSTNQSDNEINMGKLPVEIQEKNDASDLMETLPNVEQVSEIVTVDTHAAETVLTDTTDLADSGYSVFFCKDCSYKFPEERYYAVHKVGGECVFMCQFCDEKFMFRNFSKYQEHLKQHRLEKCREQAGQKASHIACPLCTKNFSSMYNMARHVENLHTLQQGRQHRCHLCGFTSDTQESLAAHKKSHQSVCADCGKVYSSKSSLNIHMKKMHSGKTYPCLHGNCLFVGTSQQVLDFHTNMHAGIKPYKCKHCGKSYPRKDSCSRHQLLCISGVTCDICRGKFKSKGTLGDHMRAVHSEERFLCLCGNTFKYRANLQRHQKKLGHFVTTNKYPVKPDIIAEPLD